MAFLGCQTQSQVSWELLGSTSDLAVFRFPIERSHELAPFWVPKREFQSRGIHLHWSQIQFRYGRFRTFEYEAIYPETKIRDWDRILLGLPLPLVVVIKEDDPVSPLTKILRSTVYFLPGEENSICYGFSELKANLSFTSQTVFSDWSQVPMLALNPSREIELKLKGNDESSSLFYKWNQGKEVYYGRVACFGKPGFFPLPTIKSIPEETESNRTPSEKLKVLESLKEQKLISPKEYEERRKKVLDSL